MADLNGQVVGFYVYELVAPQEGGDDNADRVGGVHIVYFAVHKSFRREKHGTTMMNKLLKQLVHHGMRRVFRHIRETDPAQYFLRELGFKGSLIRNLFRIQEEEEEGYEDGYLLERGQPVDFDH